MKNASKQLTKQDVTEIVQIAVKDLVSRDDLNNAIKGLASKDDLITFKDEILHEIVKMRDEVAIVGGQRDMLEDHELRIETIETRLHIQTPA